jgi:hypothetical protein
MEAAVPRAIFMHLSRLTAGALFALAASLGPGSSAPAQDMSAAPTYSRLRTGADDWHGRGGAWGYGQGGYASGYGYFPPYVSPVVAGSWYSRPYPYHFDYFRGRWDRPAPTTDCPREHGPAIESQVLPAESP